MVCGVQRPPKAMMHLQGWVGFLLTMPSRHRRFLCGRAGLASFHYLRLGALGSALPNKQYYYASCTESGHRSAPMAADLAVHHRAVGNSPPVSMVEFTLVFSASDYLSLWPASSRTATSPSSILGGRLLS